MGKAVTLLLSGGCLVRRGADDRSISTCRPEAVVCSHGENALFRVDGGYRKLYAWWRFGEPLGARCGAARGAGIALLRQR